MSIAKVNAFNWEKLLSKLDAADVKRTLNILRGKANEISSNHAKFAASKPAPIDFAAYQKKLKFTGDAVSALQKSYAAQKLPSYYAELPSFEAKKRAASLEIARSTAAAAEADLKSLYAQLEKFEASRIDEETSVEDLKQQFPHIAKEIEAEIKEHQWHKDSL